MLIVFIHEWQLLSPSRTCLQNGRTKLQRGLVTTYHFTELEKKKSHCNALESSGSNYNNRSTVCKLYYVRIDRCKIRETKLLFSFYIFGGGC